MLKQKRSKKGGKSLFKRINAWLHLWLGLISGIIVFIVSITGCMYVFEKEIRSVTQPYQFVNELKMPYLPPSYLRSVAEKHAFGNNAGKGPENSIAGLQYPGAGKAAVATYRSKAHGFMMVYINPYTGTVLKSKALEKDFFRIILSGHFNLWLPRPIGQPIVTWAVGIFIILLISGIIMWWPKNLKKANLDKSFKIKWKASFKRVNYDLHNVLGFYVCIFALMIAVTGIYFGFKWVPKAMYWVASGGKSLPDRREKIFSDTTVVLAFKPVSTGSLEDQLFGRLVLQYQNQGSLQLMFPAKLSDAITVTHNPGEGTFYKSHTRYFDRYSLAEIKGKSIFNRPYEAASGADKLIRMDYDIHVGAILGIPGKILAFFASFICASLPVTGFMVWWGKRKKKKGKAATATKNVSVAVPETA